MSADTEQRKLAAIMFTDMIGYSALSQRNSIEILASVVAQMGEPDRSIAALEKLLSMPGQGALAENGPLTPALLRLDPIWDQIRNDPRFQELAAEKTL
jgi:serine/threonine-protein kinase